jgi:hypothetical protein
MKFNINVLLLSEMKQVDEWWYGHKRPPHFAFISCNLSKELIKTQATIVKKNKKSECPVKGDPSWETGSRLAGKEIPRLLWYKETNYRVHSSPTLDSFLSQMNPAYFVYRHFNKNKNFWKELICLLSLHYLNQNCPSGSLNFIIFLYFIHLRRKLYSLQSYNISQNDRILQRVVQRLSQHNLKISHHRHI